ncbi:MAG: helix-turn-helix domain-containing protein [Spirosomataceae bacterium]
MKVTFENIAPDIGSSFRMIHWLSENDKFFWHQHPEYEIIFIKKGSGSIRVGDFQGRYEEGQLLFLGPNLPHTGLGYGVIGEHEEIIIQLREDFLGKTIWDAPEMQQIHRLFERSKRGIVFNGSKKEKVGELLEKMLEKEPFQRLLILLDVLQKMAEIQEFELMNASSTLADVTHLDEQRMLAIYKFVEENYKKTIAMKDIAEVANLTIPSFCRYFKKKTRQTFIDFLNEYRVNQACKSLQTSKGVTEICFDSGFNNVSHFNKTFKKVTGKSPKEYRFEIK